MAKNTELKKKIGQLMVYGFSGKKATPEILQMIREDHLGGIILFGRNIGSPEEVLELTTELQREAKNAGHTHPLLICVDQENGVVRRLGEGATIFPGAMLLGATRDPGSAYNIGLATGKELKALGLNWNLAPVVDVNNNYENPVIGVRSYGESPQLVAELGKQQMKGMQDAGVITTLKHFPGHGDTDVDSHLDLPTISHSMERLEEIELKPFKACIDEEADVVMTAHVYFPAIETREGVPATLSDKVIKGLLRNRLQYNGVVTTDCLEMNAIANTVGTANGALKALQAGVDLLMISHSPVYQRNALDLIAQTVANGEMDETVVNEAYERVMKLKEKYLRWEDIQLEGPITVPSIVGAKEHEELANDVYRKGITIVHNENGTLPLAPNGNQRVLLVYPENKKTMVVEDDRYSTFSLGESITHYHPEAEVLELSHLLTDEEISLASKKAKDFDTIIIATLSVQPGSRQVNLVEALKQLGKKIIVIATRSPYDKAYLPNIDAYICTYEFTKPALHITAAAVYGAEKVSGQLPVTIPKNK